MSYLFEMFTCVVVFIIWGKGGGPSDDHLFALISIKYSILLILEVPVAIDVSALVCFR